MLNNYLFRIKEDRPRRDLIIMSGPEPLLERMNTANK